MIVIRRSLHDLVRHIVRFRFKYAFNIGAGACVAVALFFYGMPLITDPAINSKLTSGHLPSSVYLFSALCVAFAAFIVVGDIGKVLAVEDRRLAISQSQYFVVHFALVLLACTIVSFVTPFGFGLARTYVMWAFLFLFISSSARFTIGLCMNVPLVMPYLLWIYWQVMRFWSYIQLKNRRPPRMGKSVAQFGSKTQRFAYRLFEVSVLSVPYIVVFTGSFATLTESGKLRWVIFAYWGWLGFISFFAMLLDGLLIAEIAGVQWNGKFLSTKRLHTLYGSLLVLSSIYVLFVWTSTSVWAIAIILGLAVPAFVLHAYIVTLFEPFISKSFAHSLRNISAKSRGSFLPSLTK